MTASTVLRRLLQALPTLFGVVLIIFVLLRVVPGDPISMMVTGESTPDDIARLRRAYGLDQPIPMQFALYLAALARGDFGTSITMKQDVLGLVLQRLPATLELALCAFVLATTTGMLAGLAAVRWRRHWPEAAVEGASAVALAIPEFLWALILVLALSVALPLFPSSGRVDPVVATAFHTQFYLLESLVTLQPHLAAELLSHLALPALALAIPLAAIIARVLRTALLEAMRQDYMLLAQVKGLSPNAALLRHALPNALIPTVTVAGVQVVLLLGGTVLVELIFAYPGLGNMLYRAAVNRDLPVIQGVTMVFSVLFVLLNLAVDLSYALLDPRIRQA